MNSESSEDPLDRIKSQIREDAAAARQRAPLPEREVVIAARVAPTGDDRATIPELARHAGPAFVDHAYRSILRRGPDPQGYERHMAALAAGANKIEVLGNLRYSAEGRRAGTKIPGLAPRYFVAKLARVPVLGALVQWLIALASLPHILRHQRANEASLAVQFGETRLALHAAEQRDAEMQGSIGEMQGSIDAVRFDLSSAVDELSTRLTQAEMHAHALRQFAESLNANVADLRHLTLAMNHWTVELRKSIDAIEAAEGERRARSDAASAALIMRERESDTSRAPRMQAWVQELARRLPPAAIVLDLCGAPDWLTELAAPGWRVSSIETNSALHRYARTRNLDVTLGSPAALLARIADASLDALTLAAPARIGNDLTPAEMLGEAGRIVKRGGALLIDIGQRSCPVEYADAELAREFGFTDPKTLDVFAGRALVLSRS